MEVHGTQHEQPAENAQVVSSSLHPANNLDAQIASYLVKTTSQHMEKSKTSFHMSLHNVVDEIVTQH